MPSTAEEKHTARNELAHLPPQRHDAYPQEVKKLRDAIERYRAEAEAEFRPDERDDDTVTSKQDVCLKDWWFKCTELRVYPRGDSEELKKVRKSTMFKCLCKAEMFLETHGDSLVPDDERIKRQIYEMLAGVREHEYDAPYNRRTAHDPYQNLQCNKRRRIGEYFEDYNDTRTCTKHDEKPCGCSECQS